MIRFVFVLLATAVAAPTTAIVATPATLHEVLDRAAPGDAITLAPGQYDPVTIKGHHWSPAVSVDATGATLRGVALFDVSGLTWHGGTFDGGDVERNGVNAQTADHLTIDGATFSHYVRNGINLGIVSDARVTGNTFADMGSDGIDIALSRRIVVDHNQCRDFHPTPGAHPDCVQMWSRPEQPPTADITITNNEAVGDMQGFTAFNHIRNGIDDGGFDRIVVENNFARVSSYHGVTLNACRHCLVRHNRAETLPNPDHPKTRAWIKVDGDDTIACDNHAKSFPGAAGEGRCHEGS